MLANSIPSPTTSAEQPPALSRMADIAFSIQRELQVLHEIVDRIQGHDLPTVGQTEPHLEVVRSGLAPQIEDALRVSLHSASELTARLSRHA